MAWSLQANGKPGAKFTLWKNDIFNQFWGMIFNSEIFKDILIQFFRKFDKKTFPNIMEFGKGDKILIFAGEEI